MVRKVVMGIFSRAYRLQLTAEAQGETLEFMGPEMFVNLIKSWCVLGAIFE
jgi:hypothetical protein